MLFFAFMAKIKKNTFTEKIDVSYFVLSNVLQNSESPQSEILHLIKKHSVKISIENLNKNVNTL